MERGFAMPILEFVWPRKRLSVVGKCSLTSVPTVPTMPALKLEALDLAVAANLAQEDTTTHPPLDQMHHPCSHPDVADVAPARVGRRRSASRI
jgi:hypothetical protein